MKKPLKRFKNNVTTTLCIILVFLFALSILASCDTENPEDKSAGQSQPTLSEAESKEETTDAESSEDFRYGTEIEVKDLDGRVINVLCRDWGSSSIQGYNGEIIQREDFGETTADMVDVAKYEIKLLIQERYNCRIEGVLIKPATQDALNVEVRKSIESGDYTYDIVFDAYSYASPLVTEGLYLDLFSIESIDFSNPWWDQNAVNDLSICNKLYFACGDINTYDNDGTWVIYFNKELMGNAFPDIDPYDMVMNNKWTFDKFAEMAKEFSADTDGIDGMTEFDTWGLGTEKYNIYVHTLAAGQKVCKKDGDDMPYLAYKGEGMYNILEDVLELYLNQDKIMVADSGKYTGYPNTWEYTVIKAFREERELFYMGGLINAVAFRSLEFPYGILPIPKHTEDQDDFYHSVSFRNMSCMLIPAGKADEEYYDLGLVIEALGAESKNTLTPVYYEKALKGKNAQTEDDEKMLDIIFGSRCFDLGAAFDWGGIIQEFMKLDINISSRFDSTFDSVKEAMDDTINQILVNN